MRDNGHQRSKVSGQGSADVKTGQVGGCQVINRLID